MKQLILNILPVNIRQKVKGFTSYIRTYLSYNPDVKRYFNYSNTYKQNVSSEKILAKIIAKYHVVEKGLTMPEMRLGFGESVLFELIGYCEAYAAKYNVNDKHFSHALKVMSEYVTVHVTEGFKLNSILSDKINNLVAQYSITACTQTETTRDDFFKHKLSNFELFSNTRHTVRNFGGTIELQKLKDAVTLAQNAPSSCNRQSSRTYIVQDKNKVDEVLALQNGNRGFGHLSDKLIIVTSELGSFSRLDERNLMYVDGGIFSMNLLYALHYHEVGACSLNWCTTEENDQKIRELLSIKPSEVVILLIACGAVPNKFKVALSPRSEASEIMTIV